MWRVLCESEVQWEGRQLYAQLVAVQSYEDVLLLLYQGAPIAASALVNGPEAAIMLFAGAAHEDGADSLRISGLGGASLATVAGKLSFPDQETDEASHDASVSFQLDHASKRDAWQEQIAQATRSRPPVTGIRALRRRFLNADLCMQDGIAALATVMQGNGLGEGARGRVRLAHMMRELVRVANSGDAFDGEGFDGHGAMVIEDKGGVLYDALRGFDGAYSRASSHLQGYCADRNQLAENWGIDFVSDISCPAFLTDLEHQLLLGPLHEFQHVVFLQLPPKAPGASFLLYAKLETHGLNGLRNSVMHAWGILGRFGVTSNDSGRGVGPRKEHKNKEQIEALTKVLDLATKDELRHLFSCHRELDVSLLPHPQLQLKTKGGWGIGDSWANVRCNFDPLTSTFSYGKKGSQWQDAVIRAVENKGSKPGKTKNRFDFIDSNSNCLALAAESESDASAWIGMVGDRSAQHSSALLASKSDMKSMVIDKANSHGRSFISEVYRLWNARRESFMVREGCDGLGAATAEALVSADCRLFRVNGTDKDHREAGRQFRFGNEVVLVYTDLQHSA
jgi:hypothetical protein